MLNEPNPAKCPKCGGGELKQLLGTFRIAGVRKKSDRDRGGEAAAGVQAPGFDDGGLDTGMDDDMGYAGDDDFGGGMEAPGPEFDDTSGMESGPADIGAAPSANEEE